MNIILFDDPDFRTSLLPLTETRPVAQIRVGVNMIEEKWNRFFNTEASHLTQDYLQAKFPLKVGEDNILINSSVLPTESLFAAINNLEPGEALLKDTVLAIRFSGKLTREEILNKVFNNLNPVPFKGSFELIKRPFDIFLKTGAEIKNDIELIKKRRLSHEINDKHTVTYGTSNIYVEEGSEIRAAIINATKGPVYIGKGAEIMEGAIIQGPTAVCDGARINMGAQIWGDTTIGPNCKVGGEVHNSVFFGNSNKAHSGYLGNSVIGEWCNLGADTNTSNLKNNYRHVRLWDYGANELVDTDLQFCGLIMGDHSKSSINSMFNTGTVVGTCANVFGAGFPDKFIPSFTWGDSRTSFQLEKAFEIAERVYARKQKVFSDVERDIFKYIHEATEKYRRHR